jgi:hypothetical protein
MNPLLFLRGLPACLLLLCGLSVRAAGIFPERKTLTVGDYSVEYTVGDEDFARAFLGRFQTTTSPAAPPAGPGVPLGLDMIRAEKPAILATICRYLALKEPDAAMRDTFDRFLDLESTLTRRMQSMAAAAPRRFQLWRSPDLKARLDAGQSIQGFIGTRDGFQLRFEATEDGTGSVTDVLWPVVINNSDTETGDALVSRKVAEFYRVRDMFRQMAGAPEVRGVFIVLHETVEMTIFSHHLHSKDRRWFCDGVANYVAWKVIEERVGLEAARQYYDLQADLAQYADVRDRVDLARWPAAENKRKPDEAGDRLNGARYAVATEVIAKVCAKHGPDLLPKLFAEVDQTPYEKRTIKTVYRAYTKLTHEDLHGYFPSRK